VALRGEGDRARDGKHRALGRGHIHDVRAQGLGTVALSGDGELVAPDEDLVDHYEW
jgi:hypothetical protein